MANDTAKTQTINIVPVQGIFEPLPPYAPISLIGPAGTPFFAPTNPNLDGVSITNSTINSSVIGGVTPAAGTFTNIATTTGTITSVPSGPTSIVNQAYVDAVAQGLSFKQPAAFTTTGNITLSGLSTQAGGDWPSTLTAGDRILVRNQTAQEDNGIYVAASSGWTRSTDANTYDEFLSAYLFVTGGTVYSGSAWVCTNQPGGTLGVTPIVFIQFSNTALYNAGTGLTLTGYTFSITNTGVTAASYGSASETLTAVVNAQGQLTSLAASPIAIANTQVSGLGTMSTQNANTVAITGGNIDGTTIGGTTAAAVTGTTVTANTQFSGPGTGLTGTASSLSIGGNAATATSATSATTATNLAGGATGSVPYQSGAGATSFLGIGSTGQVLTVAGGVPTWATPSGGTVTSVSGTGTVSGISLSGTVTSSGNLTLGGALDLSAPPTIGNATPNTIAGTTVTATTKFVGPYFDAATSAGGALRNASGAAQLQWGAGGGDNLSLGVSTNMNGANAQIDISPTGTGHVHIKPTGAGSIEIAPTNLGTINNMSIGATTASSGKFTTIDFSSTLAVSGSTGSAGQVLQSNGASPPTWVTPVAYATVTDDTTTNATRYPLFADVTSGTLATTYVSSTKYQFNPSTGVLSATSFSGAGTGLTGTASGLSIGGNAATATSATTATNVAGGAANQLVVQSGAGATTFVTAPTSGSTFLEWSGSAFQWSAAAGGVTITDDTTTNATRYVTFTDATTGTETGLDVSSTKLTYNPSTGTLRSTVVATNTVNEGTSGSGVTVDGVLVKDNGVVTGAGTVSAPAYSTTGNLNTGIYFPAADTIAFAQGGVESLRIDSSANLQFNSGYGSVATAYGCRAWVNFDGTTSPGTIAASGNVTSVTRSATGVYVVNFTGSLPDANFCVVAGGPTGNNGSNITYVAVSNQNTTTSCQVTTQPSGAGGGGRTNNAMVNVAIFR